MEIAFSKFYVLVFDYLDVFLYLFRYLISTSRVIKRELLIILPIFNMSFFILSDLVVVVICTDRIYLVRWIVVVYCIRRVHIYLVNSSLQYENLYLVQSYLHFPRFTILHIINSCYLYLTFNYCLYRPFKKVYKLSICCVTIYWILSFFSSFPFNLLIKLYSVLLLSRIVLNTIHRSSSNLSRIQLLKWEVEFFDLVSSRLMWVSLVFFFFLPTSHLVIIPFDLLLSSFITLVSTRNLQFL